MSSSLWSFVDRHYVSASVRFRKQRHEMLCALLAVLPEHYRVLDVGGTRDFHQLNPLPGSPDVVLLNPSAQPGWFEAGRYQPVQRKADALAEFADKSFALVFSNSTLAYVGDSGARAKTAAHIQRIGRRYFVQTPNLLFPIDWRTLVPFFHWLPFKAQAWFFSHVRVGKHPRLSPDYALEFAMQAQDVTCSELRRIFPGATIKRERVLGFTKSFIVYGGFA